MQLIASRLYWHTSADLRFYCEVVLCKKEVSIASIKTVGGSCKSQSINASKHIASLWQQDCRNTWEMRKESSFQ
jgi:hypothetical protein